MTTKTPLSRRTFLAAAGAAAATAAVAAPVLPTLAGPASSSRLPPRTALLEGWRALYHVEIETLAESLRRGFEAGELYAYRENDYGPMEEILDAVRAHFGLEVQKEKRGKWEWITADDATAHMILAASPFTDATHDEGWNHAAHHATEAAAWDVLTVARGRGWYTPRADECPHPNHLDEGCPDCGAQEVLS